MIRRLVAPAVLSLLPVLLSGTLPARAQQPLTQEELPPPASVPQMPSYAPSVPPSGMSVPPMSVPNVAPTGTPPYGVAPPGYSQPNLPSQGVPSAQDQPGRVFCQQNVAYHLADRDSVPDRFQPFVGIWSDAAWDPRTCAALIVESVRPDGTASILYVFGPLDSTNRTPGGVLHGTGIVRDGELRFQNSDGSQFAFRRMLSDMAGRWTTPQGQTYQTIFKATP